MSGKWWPRGEDTEGPDLKKRLKPLLILKDAGKTMPVKGVGVVKRNQ